MHALRGELDVISTKLSPSNSCDRQVYVQSTWHKLQSWPTLDFDTLCLYIIHRYAFLKQLSFLRVSFSWKKLFFFTFNSKEVCVKMFLHL